LATTAKEPLESLGTANVEVGGLTLIVAQAMGWRSRSRTM
jgi:hypothetical protein